MPTEGALKDKVIAITGAGRGIGREIALCCAREGASVVVNDVGATAGGDREEESPGAAVAAEIAELGGRAIVNRANVADPGEAESIIQDAVDAFGRIGRVSIWVQQATLGRQQDAITVTVDRTTFKDNARGNSFVPC